MVICWKGGVVSRKSKFVFYAKFWFKRYTSRTKKTVASLLKRRKLLRLKAECLKKILSLSEKTTALTVFKKILIVDLSWNWYINQLIRNNNVINNECYHSVLWYCLFMLMLMSQVWTSLKSKWIFVPVFISYDILYTVTYFDHTHM